MDGTTNEGGTQDAQASVDIPAMGDVAFGALMDALAPEKESQTGETAAGDAVPGRGAGKSTTAGSNDPTGSSAEKNGSAADGRDASTVQTSPATGGDAAGGAAEPAAGSQSADLPADWTAEASAYLPKLGQLSVALEETVTKQYQEQAFSEAREEYTKYFEALETHPRLLAGTEVPAIGKEGTEILRDSADAKEWQEAVRALLVAEIEESAKSKMEESGGQLQTLHASIDLFKNNPDLIPGTKQFNRELADKFAALAKPYEIRQDGNGPLLGYSITVQPIIEALRMQQAQPATVQAAGSPTPPASPPAEPPAAPQAGIQSKAGSASETEDFSTLFGTIGLPHLQI